ncbi:hypothetical protein ACS0TY_023637 [Phlomoides rotata]
METVYQIIAAAFVFLVSTYAWRTLKWAYITPRKQEKALRKQGLTGNSYNLIYGDLKEMMKMNQEAKSKPINLGDDIKTRLQPFFIKTIQRYGALLSQTYPIMEL